jgi:hypothetical protein
MEQENAIEHAVEEAIAEVENYSPAHPANQIDVVVNLATLKFNRFAEMTGNDFGIESFGELEVKCEVEAERQLNFR